MKKPSHLHIHGEPVKYSKMENRSRSRHEYHTARWTRRSRAFRQEHPLCNRCKGKGIIRAAQVTDHIVPVEVCGDFWNEENWQSLCTPCNIEKGIEDKKLIQQYRNEQRKTN